MPSIYETPCKTCVFAKYSEDTQYGCAFDRVKKFKEQGIEVVEAFDEQKEFYVIKTICRAHRDKKSPWAMRYSGSIRKEVCRKELELDIDVVIVLDGNYKIDDLKTTIQSLLSQTLLPAKVTVVLNQDSINVNEIRSILPADWIVKLIIKQNKTDKFSRGYCIDLAVADSKSAFYALFNPGFVVPKNFMKDIDESVNDELNRFVLLTPNKAGEGCVVQMKAHQYYGGNAEAEVYGDEAGNDLGLRVDSINEKILHRVKKEDQAHLVKSITEVCGDMGEGHDLQSGLPKQD